MTPESRRHFLTTSGSLFIGAAALGPVAAYAAGGQHHHGSSEGLIIDAATQNTCATCQFWGGMRKVSSDKQQVAAQSMGWCNNTDSLNHQKLTAADHEMKKPGIWKRWAVLS